MIKKEKRIQIVFKIGICVEEDDGGFHAFCPALKGVHAPGDTRDEAIENAKEAIVLYIKSLIEHKEPIPLPVMQLVKTHERSGQPSHACPPEQIEDVLVTV
ncbi:MAG: type II toxin-antitoxin system HicB family antitoxin [Candidatus Lindowbacteria bacterium]|nr:type II toxin-antitoxin system HicB family antitoxin [Candidatus Lindowbacteria bacterium]